jgi:hypothetical protein
VIFVWENRRLVDKHVHFLNQDAVSRDKITCLKEQHIPDHNLADVNFLAGALLPSENS